MINKHLVSAALIIMVMIAVTACTSRDIATSASTATPDQSETSASGDAAAEAAAKAGSQLTVESKIVLESSISATETHSAMLATSNAAPTDIPTQFPSVTSTPTSSSTPAPYPYPFNKSLPLEWRGIFFGGKEGIIQIEKVWTGGRYSGNFYFAGNETTTLINGIIVEKINQFELSKWEQIERFNEDETVTHVRFVESSVIEGDPEVRLDGLYLATVNQEGVMRGLYFYNHETNEPFISFEFLLSE